MRKSIITTIFAAFVAAASVQLSYAANTPRIGSSAAGTTDSVATASALSNEAGSIAAGANSALNPSATASLWLRPVRVLTLDL